MPARKPIRMRGQTKYGKRHKPGVMNQTETLYAEILQGRKFVGEVDEWHFESVTFKLADGTRYTPDFWIRFTDGSVECVDTKGSGPVDAKSVVKIKCAAEKWPEITWAIEKRKKPKDGGGWERIDY